MANVRAIESMVICSDEEIQRCQYMHTIKDALEV